MFTLKIETDNAAFADGSGPYELERILKEVGEAIRLSLVDVPGQTAEGRLRDVNGNTVGEWSLNAPEEEVLIPSEDSGTAPATEEAAIRAMCEAHDREESAQKGEPTPWREDFEKDPDWEQERFLAMREAFDVARTFFAAEGERTVPFPTEIKVWPRADGDEITDEVAFVLGLAAKPWVLQQVWVSLRLGGVVFPAKAEAEFAAALHWLVVHVLTPGSGGADTIDAALTALRASAIRGNRAEMVITDGLEEG